MSRIRNRIAALSTHFTATASATSPSNTPISGTASVAAPGPTAAPALSVSKVADQLTYAKPGDSLSYTIVATNTGNVTLSNVSVSDAKLSGLTCSPALPVASMAPKATITCQGWYLVTQADLDARTIPNTATVVGTPVTPSSPQVPATPWPPGH